VAITLERDSKPNLVRHDVYAMQRAQEREDAEGDDDVADDFPELTEEEQGKLKILRYCSALYDDARKAREPYETFDVAWDLFIGNVWPSRWPTWRAKITINKIRAFITFMQAVMTDNKPRISVDPLVPGTEDAADLLRKLVDRDWDENDMQAKISIFVLYGLVWGTGFMKIAFDPKADGGRGRHRDADRAVSNLLEPHSDLRRRRRVHPPRRRADDGVGAAQLPRARRRGS